MAFGIGINAQRADAGTVKGRQKEVACECWFTTEGKITPRLIKLQDEEGEVQTIREIRIHSQEKKIYAGIPSIEYDCTLVNGGRSMRARLIYYVTENRWVVNFNDW